MRHKLLYLLALALTATSSGWGQDSGGVPAPFSTQTIDKTDLKTTTGLFANGHAITIESGSSEEKIKVSTTDMEPNVSYEIDGATTVVFGGKYNESCESSSVTMKSGTVHSIVGGGYGTSSGSVAKVTTANIYLEGGTVSKFIVGGGALWSEVTTAYIKTQGEGAFTHNSWMIPAMESGSSNNSNGKYPEYDKATCKVENFNVTLNKGTYWIIALAGGNGHYAYTKNGKASIKGTAENPIVIRGGLFGCGSNGRGDTAEAEVAYCTMSDEALELASVNRGKLKSVKFSFTNCTFSDKVYAYLGGTYMWGDQYASSEVGIPESVEFTFDPSCTGIPTVGISEGLDVANVTLTGAKAKIASFARDKTTNITSFTIGTGKTWTFKDGLEIDKGVTLTKNGKLVSAITAEQQAEKEIGGKIIKPYDVYANGTPIEITAYSTDSVKITKQGETTVAFKVPSISSVYGGAKESPVASTSIKMTSGKIWNLYGGGRSEKKDSPANVSGTASIEIAQGTTVSNLLVGGGYWYSKADKIDVDLQGATVQFFCVGGFDQGKTTNRIDTPLGNSVNGANTVDIHMNGGSIYVMGCGGGQGYSLTGESTVTLEGGTVIDYFYGTYSNGHADKITVNATNCTFKSELATINRGQVGKSFFTFDQCSFGDQSNTAMIASLGAADGWADSDTNGKILPIVSDSVSYTFTGSKTAVPDMKLSRGLENADVEVTGARVLMTYFRDGTAVGNTTTDFILNTGKTWTFNGGLKCEGDKYTFTKQGTLKATAPEASDLLTLAGVHADTISLVEATYELPSQLTITKPMALTGAGMDKTFIKAGAADWAHTYNADLNLISIENAADITPAEGGEVVISNLTASNAKRIGLNVQTSMAVKLDTVTLKDNTAAGLVVHSKVEATDMHTSGNAWGGVNIDNGTPAYSTLCFTFDEASTFDEPLKVWSEILDNADIVKAPESWEYINRVPVNDNTFALWLERLIVPAGETITADAAYAGRNVYIENTGTLNVTAPLALAKVTMEEGAQLIPALTDNNKVTATTLQLNTTLKEDKWTAFGFPKAFTLSTADGQTTYAEPTKDTKTDKGAYFAGLKDNTAPVFEYKDAFGTSGLLSANTGDWQVSATGVELKAEAEPDAPTTPTFILYANPNTYDMPLVKNKSVYVFDAANNEFVQCTGAVTLKPFESVILTDANTYSTLRSLRLGDNIVTGTQVIEPVEGYYVSTERGAIVIHTAEPVQVLIVEMSGRIAYKGMATDGQRIMVPTGIYAVNGQLVRVK